MEDLASQLRQHAEEVLDPGYPYYGTPEMVREAAGEIERLRLTDEEREAIRSACESVKMVGTEKCFTTLRGLIERLA